MAHRGTDARVGRRVTSLAPTTRRTAGLALLLFVFVPLLHLRLARADDARPELLLGVRVGAELNTSSFEQDVKSGYPSAGRYTALPAFTPACGLGLSAGAILAKTWWFELSYDATFTPAPPDGASRLTATFLAHAVRANAAFVSEPYEVGGSLGFRLLDLTAKTNEPYFPVIGGRVPGPEISLHAGLLARSTLGVTFALRLNAGVMAIISDKNEAMQASAYPFVGLSITTYGRIGL